MKRAIFSTIVLAGALSACKPQPVRPPNLQTLPTPEAALGLVRSDGAERKTMRSLGRATYFGPKGRIRLRIVVVVERPGKFRLETLSPLEQPIDVMTSDGQRLWLLSQGKFHEGPATPENIARIVPVRVRPEDLVDAMLGGVPTSDRFKPVGIQWADDKQLNYAVQLEGPGGEPAEVVIDPVEKVVLTLRAKRPDGGTRLEVRFEDFETVANAGAFPRKVIMKIPGEKDEEVTIKLKDLDVNVPINPVLFTLNPPPGAMVERLNSPPAALPPTDAAPPATK